MSSFPTQKLHLRAARAVKQNFKEDAVILAQCGSFNPVTVMHTRIFGTLFFLVFHTILENAKDFFLDAGIPVLGAYISPVNAAYKKPGLLPPEHRLTMCRLAVESSDLISVDDWEMYDSHR